MPYINFQFCSPRLNLSPDILARFNILTPQPRVFNLCQAIPVKNSVDSVTCILNLILQYFHRKNINSDTWRCSKSYISVTTSSIWSLKNSLRPKLQFCGKGFNKIMVFCWYLHWNLGNPKTSKNSINFVKFWQLNSRLAATTKSIFTIKVSFENLPPVEEYWT